MTISTMMHKLPDSPSSRSIRRVQLGWGKRADGGKKMSWKRFDRGNCLADQTWLGRFGFLKLTDRIFKKLDIYVHAKRLLATCGDGGQIYMFCPTVQKHVGARTKRRASGNHVIH